MQSSFFLVSLLLEIVLAVQPEIAVPAVTAAPEEWLVRARMEPRAVGSNTCGWVNGLTSDAITCNESGAQCASNSLVWGCCTGALNNCILPTVCFDTSLASALNVKGNSYTLVCTEAASPYCQTFGKQGGVQYALACGPTDGFFEVYTSANGGAVANVGVSAAPTGLTNAAAGTAAATAAGLNGGAISAPTSAATTAAGAGAQGTAGNGGGNGSGGSALSTGAIVAIAVCGGLVAIAVICLVAFLVHKKQKKNKANRPAVGYPQNVFQQGPPPPQANNVPAGSEFVGGAPGQPMTQQNVNAMLASQAPNEWAYVKQGVAQHQTAAAQGEDGIKITEIMPEDAVDERRQQEMMSNVGSNVPTAVAPTVFSHNVQGV